MADEEELLPQFDPRLRFRATPLTPKDRGAIEAGEGTPAGYARAAKGAAEIGLGALLPQMAGPLAAFTAGGRMIPAAARMAAAAAPTLAIEGATGDSRDALVAGTMAAGGEALSPLLNPVGSAVAKGGQSALSGFASMLERAGVTGAAAKLKGLAGRMDRPFQPNVLPGAADAQESLARHGATLTMDQVTADPGYQAMGKIARILWFSRGRVAKTQDKAIQVGAREVDDMVESLVKGTDPITRGKVAQDTLKGSDNAFHVAAKKTYDELDALFGDVPQVDYTQDLAWAIAKRQELDPLRDANAIKVLDTFISRPVPQGMPRGLAKPPTTAERKLDELREMGEGGASSRYAKETTRQDGKLSQVKQIQEDVKYPQEDLRERTLKEITTKYPGEGNRVLTPEQVTYAVAHEDRSTLLRLRRAMPQDPGPNYVQVLKELESRIGNRIDEAGAKIPTAAGTAREAHRAAQSFYRSGKEMFDSQFLTKLVETENPSTIVEAVANAAPEDVRRVRQAYDLLIENTRRVGGNVAQAQARRDSSLTLLQGSMAKRILDRSKVEIAPGLETYDGNKLYQELASLRGEDRSRINELFSPGEHEKFWEGLNHLRLALSRPKGGTPGQLALVSREGSMTITVMSTVAAGALGGLATGAAGPGIGIAATFLLADRALGKILTNKAAVDALVNGLKEPAGTRLAARATAQLMAHLVGKGVLKAEDVVQKMGLPIPEAGNPLSTGEKPTSPTDIQMRSFDTKNRNGRAESIEKLWEAKLAPGAPQ